MKKKRKIYPDTMKRVAVRSVLEGVTCVRAGAKLGCHGSTVGIWVKSGLYHPKPKPARNGNANGLPLKPANSSRGKRTHHPEAPPRIIVHTAYCPHCSGEVTL